MVQRKETGVPMPVDKPPLICGPPARARQCSSWLLLFAALALPAVAGAQGIEEKRYQIPLENSPSLGPADAPVTMVEFLDFQ